MKTVRTVLGTLSGLTLLISLSAYGVSAYTKKGKAVKVSASGAVSTQEEFDRIIIARETHIVSQLGLSPEQQREYDTLRAEQDAKTHAFRTRRPFRPEEGMELNVWWNQSVQEVFTPEQYNHYLRLWSSGPGSVAAPATDLAQTFVQTETQILASLDLTAQQRRQVNAHQATMRQRNSERQEVLVTGDRKALLKHDAETVRINQKMKNILTAAQYRQYLAAWGKAVPSSNHSGVAYSPARRRQ